MLVYLPICVHLQDEEADMHRAKRLRLREAVPQPHPRRRIPTATTRNFIPDLELPSIVVDGVTSVGGLGPADVTRRSAVECVPMSFRGQRRSENTACPRTKVGYNHLDKIKILPLS